MIKEPTRRKIRLPRNIFYGWWIAVISASVDSMKHGTFNKGFTSYIIPLRNELGIGVAAISFAEMLGRMEGGLQGPLMGWATDRFGPRVILMFGGITSGLGFILLSFTQNYLYFICVFVGLLSLGFRAGYNNATMPAINQWFRRHRGLAMGLAGMGTAVGGTVIAPLMGFLVLSAGWRPAAFISGVVILVVVIPMSFLIRRDPESMGLRPDGDPIPENEINIGEVYTGEGQDAQRDRHGAAVLHAGEPDFMAAEAMRTPTFWMLVLAVGMRNTVHSGVTWLMVPMIVWFLMGSGRSEDGAQPIAVAFVGVMSFSLLLMTPLVGWLGDRWSKKKLSSACMIGGALSMLVLVEDTGHIWQVVAFVVLLSFSETANPLAWAIMGDFFGRRSYATLRGWQHLPDQFMSMSTPVWMGVIFDHTGSYKWALIPLVVIYCLAALFYWLIPTPKTPARVLAYQKQAEG
ncbi:MAG: MFS transporter [SAR202 cluster bacterium]|nr:MFS transporter [SAR202 cluster bacterium]